MTWDDASALERIHILIGPDCELCGCPRHVHRGRTLTPGLQAYDGYCSVCTDSDHTYTSAGIDYSELRNREMDEQVKALNLPAMELWPKKRKKRWFQAS